MEVGMSKLVLVVIESPLAGNVRRNTAYAKAAMRDCLARGEAPYASHLLFAQDGILDDTISEEREQGIEAGLAWAAKASISVVYVDLGVSAGMRRGIDRAHAEGRQVEMRTIASWVWPPAKDEP
jgi:hypothetical protein